MPQERELNTDGLPPAPPAFYVAGATGVGKSEFAVQLAEQLGGEIVGADAFQIYAGLPVLTAQPSEELRARIPHHLIGEVPLTESFDVAAYVTQASARIREIHARGKLPIVTGGTGLFVRSLVRGLADLPKADAELRAELEKTSLLELNQRLAELDPDCASSIDSKNPRRVIRALEVCLLTGKPFSSFRQEWSDDNPTAAGVVLLRNKEALQARIDARVRQMFREGVVGEVSTAGAMSDTAAQVLGLREIQLLLRGELTEAGCIASIQTQTRQYAKRQSTWFAKEPWLDRIDLGNSMDGPLERAVAAARCFASRI